MMSDNLTQRPQATPAHTRVLALVNQTGQLGRTVRADNTLGPAVGRGAQVAGGAGALTPGPRHPVGREWAAVVVVTRLPGLG